MLPLSEADAMLCVFSMNVMALMCPPTFQGKIINDRLKQCKCYERYNVMSDIML